MESDDLVPQPLAGKRGKFVAAKSDIVQHSVIVISQLTGSPGSQADNGHRVCQRTCQVTAAHKDTHSGYDRAEQRGPRGVEAEKTGSHGMISIGGEQVWKKQLFVLREGD
jgi:hypothetical protein